MTRDEFWKHIAVVDGDALERGDEEAAIAPVQRRLKSLPVSELEGFAEHLSRCLYALDGQAYAEESGESGDSDDAFLYARCYVVARGREHYEAALRNPKLMPKTLEHWCESLLYAHRYAWSVVTGRDVSEWIFDPSVSYESGSNAELWPR